ncbi:MAG: SDR family NAD(P)-dependent oxidoreductase [Planctomycetota bacterium]|nr:SDR family NAD(P)-dependent oxidoreductase [Planctomycetota bacterium]
MQISLQHKLALVTGGGSGIGRGVSHVLAKAGATVVVVDVNAAGGQETVDAIAKAGGKAIFLRGDVGNAESMTAVLDRVADEPFAKDGLHLLVNNAGIEYFKGIQAMSLAEYDETMHVDLRGIFVCTKLALPLLKKAGAPGAAAAKGGANVVNIASVHAHATVADLTAYAAAKGGVVAMTRSLSQELGPLGIRVNSISPGFVDTPMVRRWLESQANPKAELERVHKLHAVPRIGQPEDIGHMVAFLASEYAGFVVGSNITIDGGLTNRLQH